MDSEMQFGIILVGGSFIIWVLYWMISVLSTLKKSKRYQYMQVLLLQKLLEKEGVEVKLNDLYNKAIEVS